MKSWSFLTNHFLSTVLIVCACLMLSPSSSRAMPLSRASELRLLDYLLQQSEPSAEQQTELDTSLTDSLLSDLLSGQQELLRLSESQNSGESGDTLSRNRGVSDEMLTRRTDKDRLLTPKRKKYSCMDVTNACCLFDFC